MPRMRIARAEEATLVPAYILVVPRRYSEESPLTDEVAVAMPLLEAVERAAVRAGVPVDARIEKGRSLTHALRLLWEVGARSTGSSRRREGTATAGSRRRPRVAARPTRPAETLVLKPYEQIAA